MADVPNFNDLPNELKLKILDDVDDLDSCKLVCCEWRNLVSDIYQKKRLTLDLPLPLDEAKKLILSVPNLRVLVLKFISAHERHYLTDPLLEILHFAAIHCSKILCSLKIDGCG